MEKIGNDMMVYYPGGKYKIWLSNGGGEVGWVLWDEIKKKYYFEKDGNARLWGDRLTAIAAFIKKKMEARK